MTDFFKITLIVFGAVAGGSILLCLSYIVAYQQYLLKKINAPSSGRKMPHYRWVVLACIICTFLAAVVVMCGAVYEEQVQVVQPEPYYARVVYEYEDETHEIRIYEDSSFTELPVYGPDEDLCDFKGWYFDMLFTSDGTEIQYTRNVFNMLKGTSFTISLFPRWESPQRQQIYVWEELSKDQKSYLSEDIYIHSPYALIKNAIMGYYDISFDGTARDVIVEGKKYVSENNSLRVYLGGWSELQGNKVTFLTKEGALSDDFGIRISLAELKDGDTVALEAYSSAMYKLDLEKDVYTIGTSNDGLKMDGVYMLNDSGGPRHGYNYVSQWMTAGGRSAVETIIGADYMGYPMRYVQFTNPGDTYREGVAVITPGAEAADEGTTLTAPRGVPRFYRFTASEYGRYTFTDTAESGIRMFYDDRFNLIYSVNSGSGIPGSFDRIVLQENETVYVSIFNGYGDANLTVQRTDSPFEWYVDGKLVCHSAEILKNGPRPQVSVFYNGVAVRVRIRSIDNFKENIHEFYSGYIIYKLDGFIPSAYSAGTRIVLQAYEGDLEYASAIELTIIE